MNLSRKHLWVPVVGLLAIAISCKKQDLVPQENVTQEVKALGALPDDPLKVAEVPLMVSTRYLTMKATGKGGTKGKKGGGTTGSTDITPPTVSITSPSNQSSVSGYVTISVSASDNVGVKNISVTINGSAFGTSNTAPYSFSWNTDLSPDGVYTIEAKAVDAAGNWSTSTIAVTKNTEVINPPPPTSTGFSLATPAVSNQGSEGSCVAFAVGYATRSIDYYYAKNDASYSYSSNIFSPEYLYNQTKASTDCGSGSSVLTALNFLQTNGICTWSTMPYSSGSCSLVPTSSQSAEAANYKIQNYKALYTSDITAIKAALNNKHPLIIAFVVDSYFYNARAGFIWKSFSSTLIGRHAVAIVGYDDSKNAVKVMNSWGTGWGDAGYSWIDYNFLPQVTNYAYGVNL